MVRDRTRDLPDDIRFMLYDKPGIGPSARRRLRKNLGLQGSGRYGNTRRKIRYLRDIAFARQRGRCFYCGVAMVQPIEGVENPNMATADHLLPRVEGGADVECNIVAACRACNNMKADKDIQEFKAELIRRMEDDADRI